uniref:ABC transporter G family member 31 n=1 Tax=Tanacetum cinerariifolium TaxID=118510 RepID=A0A699HE83_TANCI|nr:ABC transporter G family member 31 [Tanacetum cinerariifolium]
MAASDGSEYFDVDIESGLDTFSRRSNADEVQRDEMELLWTTIDRLPSRQEKKYALVKRSSGSNGGVERTKTVIVTKLDMRNRSLIVRKALDTFEKVNIEADVLVGSRALPTLVNYTRDAIEHFLISLRIFRPRRHQLSILKDISSSIKPGRMTMLLGPPGSRKSTLLLALAGKLDSSLKKTGKITYNEYELHEFYVQRTSAYISQTDNHIGELTVRETLDFGARWEGEGFVGNLRELTSLEKENKIRPSPKIDAFIKVSSVAGKMHSISTDYMLKVLALDVCSETVVGNDMLRGISGGQRKRVNTGEMVVGPRKTLSIDEISTELDSSTTFQIMKCIKNFVHQMEATGPRKEVLKFFESLGFQKPLHKGTADFLQEATSRKDQEQYWADSSKPYEYIKVSKISKAYENSIYGRSLKSSLSIPFDKSKSQVSALRKRQYGVSKWNIFQACFSSEYLLIKRQSFLYIFKTIQVAFVGFVTCTLFLRIRLHPTDVVDGSLVGFSPSAGRFFRYMLVLFSIHQMALGLFRTLATMARNMIISNTFGSAALLMVFLLGGFIMPKEMIKPWWVWGFWVSPLSYAQRTIAVNEFTATRWMKILPVYALVFNIIVTLSLAYLNPLKNVQIVPASTTDGDGNQATPAKTDTSSKQHGMTLPFKPLSMAFHNVNYYVDMPKDMDLEGVSERRLKLLSDVSGVFLPGVFTALMGSSGAGKTTLLDVLAGRKIGGYIKWDISISVFKKEQSTFARVAGYVEQNDIHSPQVTVIESLLFSDFLRLPVEVSEKQRWDFVEGVMKLVELDNLKDALVGLLGCTGLSTEQRKRLTIAVELVANPSIIFMDEPTSRLDARVAVIVMRTVCNTVDTGRTMVCTIHQPSIEIFEAFDELLLLKRGGSVIYGGKVGGRSDILIDYFESINGITKMPSDYNPANWMLEMITPAVEERIRQTLQ